MEQKLNTELSVSVKSIMNSDEIEKWKHGEYLKPLVGDYHFGKWCVRIRGQFMGVVNIEVWNNACKVGRCVLDNKDSIGSLMYSPTIRFINQINDLGCGYVSNDYNITERLYGNVGDTYTVTPSLFIKLAKKSFNKLINNINEE